MQKEENFFESLIVRILKEFSSNLECDLILGEGTSIINLVPIELDITELHFMKIKTFFVPDYTHFVRAYPVFLGCTTHYYVFSSIV